MTASQQITERISQLPSWQGVVISQFRAIILAASPDLVEEWKWNTGMWTLGGKLVCGFGAFKEHVKLNFMQGAQLPDPAKLFNNGFEAKTSRSIDVREHDTVDQAALVQLVEAAVATAGQM